MGERFKWAVERVLEHEGGYVNNPSDPGGETNFGISRRFIDSVGLDVKNIKALTKTRARKIYAEHFWLGFLDELADPVLALQVFDFGVNAGTSRSTKLLQASVGAYQDGAIGPKSLAAVAKHETKEMRRRFALRVLLYYGSIANNRPELRQFQKSWIHRALDNLLAEVKGGENKASDRGLSDSDEG